MDWKRLAAQQTQQLFEKNDEVQQLHLRYGIVAKKANELQIQVIELKEQLERTKNTTSSCEAEELRLKLQELQEEKTKNEQSGSQALAKLQDEAGTGQGRMHKVQLRCDELGREKTALIAELNAQREQIKSWSEKCEHLTYQLQAEKRADSRRFPAFDPEKYFGSDDDDSEPEANSIKSEATTNRSVQPSKATAPKMTPTRPAYRPPPPLSSSTSPLLPSRPASRRFNRRTSCVIADDSDSEASSSASLHTCHKRSRSEDSKIDDDELLFLSSAEHLTPSAPKRQRANVKVSESTDLPEFIFNAITGYNADGSPQGYAIADLEGVMQDLWDNIGRMKNWWEQAKGELWHEEFLGKSYKAVQCVTNKLCRGQELDGVTFAGHRTRWHKGYEGMFACKDCAESGWPCFTYKEGEFLLLPMSEEDRVKKVEENFEIRYWINERN